MSRSSVGSFSSHGTENFLCFRKFPVSKKFLDKKSGTGGVSRFCVRNGLSHSADKVCRETLLCFRNFPVSIKFTDKSCVWWGQSRFFVRNFLSHSTGKPRRGTILCFRNFLVSNSFMDKRGEGITIFRQKLFVAQYRKSS